MSNYNLPNNYGQNYPSQYAQQSTQSQIQPLQFVQPPVNGNPMMYNSPDSWPPSSKKIDSPDGPKSLKSMRTLSRDNPEKLPDNAKRCAVTLMRTSHQ